MWVSLSLILCSDTVMSPALNCPLQMAQRSLELACVAGPISLLSGHLMAPAFQAAMKPCGLLFKNISVQISEGPVPEEVPTDTEITKCQPHHRRPPGTTRAEPGAGRELMGPVQEAQVRRPHLAVLPPAGVCFWTPRARSVVTAQLPIRCKRMLLW